ncbi:phosphatase PAP2 family protein [Streptomyces gilvus]|uniref:phosphatase PAP2 family protein n=1 Tax=Streptomyces gilvus TaxID=2920937 RepID=UPI001F0E6690|nr:phosphatase PAP2 family protein [Streptomyces sp. CME 23]MCH5670393.1 phosphatase PAP2 family protein [Streptomyces sp. CME 23]
MTPLAFGGASVDGGLYTWITRLAHHTSHPLDTAIAVWSDYGLALFAVLMLVAWWRARGAGEARMVRALATPLIVMVVYAVDMLVKSAVAETRPCRTLHVVTVEACPAAGDWSFPSNHAVIAGAAAVAIALTDRRLTRIAAPAAVLMAISRVWIGAHYPHDVAVGLALGALLAWLLMRLADRGAPLVRRVAATRFGGLVTGV